MSYGPDPTPGTIVLVGFMAAGKSTVGRLLARRLGWDFVDFDQRILERTGLTAGKLIRERGEDAFREMEAEVTAEVAGSTRLVLAPGGGWVTRPELAHHLGDGTVRVWLRVTSDEVLRRAALDSVDRPLLGPSDGRRDRVEELLRGRTPLYESAEVVVDVDDREPAIVVDEIIRRLGLEQESDER
jgi:shikimate kinase